MPNIVRRMREAQQLLTELIAMFNEAKTLPGLDAACYVIAKIAVENGQPITRQRKIMLWALDEQELRSGHRLSNEAFKEVLYRLERDGYLVYRPGARGQLAGWYPIEANEEWAEAQRFLRGREAEKAKATQDVDREAGSAIRLFSGTNIWDNETLVKAINYKNKTMGDTNESRGKIKTLLEMFIPASGGTPWDIPLSERFSFIKKLEEL